jgi:hypothetical protein
MMKWDQLPNQDLIGMKFKANSISKLRITHFGLLGHEVAVLKSTMESAPDLDGDYELREPNNAGACDIVVVNQDSQVATSWWKNYKKRNPAAVPLFLTDSKESLDDGVYNKRPFSPSVLRAAVQDLVSNSRP